MPAQVQTDDESLARQAPQVSEAMMTFLDRSELRGHEAEAMVFAQNLARKIRAGSLVVVTAASLPARQTQAEAALLRDKRSRKK